MRSIHVYTLLLSLVICNSGEGQNKTVPAKTKDIVSSPRPDDRGVHTKYEYTDSIGKRLIIQNGFPKGGSTYTDPNGKVYGYAVFWTRIINETETPLELEIEFLDSYEVPSLPDKYYKLVVPRDTMTIDRIPLFNYGLTDLDSFLDTSIHKPSSLKKTINPKESSAFFVVKLALKAEGPHGGGDILRTGLILKGQDLFYRVSVYNNSPASASLITEKEINCGSINLKNLILRK
jgi:hypothetical protein